MAYTAGLLKHHIVILNRQEAESGRFGLDSAGIEWVQDACMWASVEWQKGKTGMRDGALDSYGVVLVRMRWNSIATTRSRIIFEGQTYQVLPETFHADKQANTIQFLAQAIVES